jgi:hypothetical protein
MKKLLLIAAVTIATVSAHASKARLDSLQNAAHLSDIQNVWQAKPDQAVNYEAATVEFGSTTATQNAEGGFIRKMGDSAWSLYLGRSSSTYAAATAAVADTLGANSAEKTALNSAFKQDNSLQLTYAMKAGSIQWGVGLFHVGNDFKNSTTYDDGATTVVESFSATKKQTVTGILASATNGTWDAQLRQGLAGKTELKTISGTTLAGLTNGSDYVLNSTNSTKVSGGWLMDTMYFYGAVEMSAGDLKKDGVKQADNEATVFNVGVVNSHKKDGVDFFYGAGIASSSTKEKVANTKTDSTVFPLIVGVEADVNSWLTLRGSLTQNLGLLSSSKTKGAKSTSVAESTTSRLGAGFKWGKATIDATIGAGSTGTLGLDDDGNNFAMASVTYNF